VTPDDRFARCETLVLIDEGGSRFTNSPKDRGGPTRWGVSLAALTDWRGHPCTADDVAQLLEPEARAIYRAKYWPPGDQLPAGVDYMLFDAAVNCGRSKAAKFLQTALKVTVDGAIGPATLAAVAASDPVGLIEPMRAARAAYYRGLDDFPTWGNGWLKRNTRVAQTSTAWAQKG
jgi:lysozyme family protein